MHCNGYMNVAWGFHWGGNWNTKSCVFPCKVAAGDDERHLLYAAVAAAVDLPFFLCRIVTVVSSCFGCTSACVIIRYFGICGYRSHRTNCMILIIWSCHMRRFVQVCDVMLRNAL